MKYIYYTLSVLLLVLSFTACKETDEYKSPEESLAEENALLERYYNEPMGNGMTRLEYDTYNALDTIDHRSTTGMMLYLLPNDGYKELGDSVRVNKRVGYRYNIYKISVNNDTGVTEEFQYASNYNTSVPVEFTTAPVALFSTQEAAASGINEAVLNMQLYGKAKVVLPSPIGLGSNQGYYTTIYEIEVTYLGE